MTIGLCQCQAVCNSKTQVQSYEILQNKIPYFKNGCKYTNIYAMAKTKHVLYRGEGVDITPINIPK